ncbi:hypothetical protein [uncultured Eubacterium sp.]|uniref:hypothetical protein n=1 Tax=uncultured Eubacterium sp. TaxID=165185 RepID=UPI0033905528
MFYQTFEDLYENHAIEIDDDVLKKYAQNWHRPSAMDSLETYDEADEHRKVVMLYEPRGAQIEALCALEQTRAEGAKKSIDHGCNRNRKDLFSCVRFGKI